MITFSANHPIKPDYLEEVRKFYQAVAESLDFEKAEEAAGVLISKTFVITDKNFQIINKFVKDETCGKITDFISPDIIKDAFALLVNAVYFKADWLEPFEKNSTSERDFHGEEGVRKVGDSDKLISNQ